MNLTQTIAALDFDDVCRENCSLCEERDSCFYGNAVNIAVKCIEKQIELRDFIGRLDPTTERELIVILSKYLVEE